MNSFVVFACLLAMASGMPQELVSSVPLASTLVRAPAHDSASIESHRLGGNFAYAVAEAHAFAKVTPQLNTVVHPVAETTVVHEPAEIAHVQPGQVVTTKHIPQPIIEHQPIFQNEPIVQARTTYTQPIFKAHTVTQHVAAVPAIQEPLIAHHAHGPAFAAGPYIHAHPFGPYAHAQPHLHLAPQEA